MLPLRLDVLQTLFFASVVKTIDFQQDKGAGEGSSSIFFRE